MKKIILRTLVIAAFCIGPTLSKIFSQPPPPPPPGGGHGQPGNKSVPVGEGIYILGGLALLYGAARLYKAYNPPEIDL